LDWQLSALVQVLDSFLSSLPALESLHIAVDRDDLQSEIEVGEIEVTQWRELLQSFTAIKNVTLESEELVELVAPLLQELARERATEVLPALQNIFVDTRDWLPYGRVKEAIGEFIGARQLSDRPVTAHYWDRRRMEYR
jgi:hypothetical protein